MISNKTTLFYSSLLISIVGSYYFLSSDTFDLKMNGLAVPVKSVLPNATGENQPAGEINQHNSELLTMPVNEAVMVTAELDYGGKPPSIAEALNDIERIYLPDDMTGRTFSILDAYGEVTAENKLHISMHVSSEKKGIGKIKFKRTGEILWQSKIVADPAADPSNPKEKKLTILIDNVDKKSYTIDGSNNPASILQANIKELNVPVSTYWKDGTEKEFIFIYSACGCPVKVMVKRVGDKTIRTKQLPVIFPDDPAALNVISHLMRWVN